MITVVRTARSPRPLIIPIENQQRELESRLLLACVAAERGFRVVIGSRTQIHLRIGFFPRGIYFAKSLAASSVRMLTIMRKLRHEMVAAVDDALVPPPPDQYFKMRVAPAALQQISAFFAWGEENAELFREHLAQDGIPIYITGNPRTDLLRPELLPYFDAEVADIRRRFGNFVLINTNFSKLNHYLADRGRPRLAESRSANLDPDTYPARLHEHRNLLYGQFRQLVPDLSKSFPGSAIVLRPHPVENPAPWRAIAAPYSNVHVVLEGNVIPWLLASKVLIHNACSTGIEAFLLGVPTIAYHPVTSESLDPELPSFLSYRAYDVNELCEFTSAILSGERGPCDEPAQWQRIERRIASLHGALASERIVDVLERTDAEWRHWEEPTLDQHLGAWVEANGRAIWRIVESRIPGARRNLAYQHHRFPGMTADAVLARIRRFERALGRFGELRVKELSRNIFQIAR